MQFADRRSAAFSSRSDGWAQAMGSGDFARAWRISDRHLRHWRTYGPPKHEGPRHLQTIWDGRPLRGKRVLVRCYHGLGDTIQFIRFAAPLRAIARHVIVWVQPKLLPLIATVAGVDEALPLNDGTPNSDFDADIEIMELAHALRVDAEAIRRPLPYLAAPGPLPSIPGAGLAVGLVWQAGDWDPCRSLSAEAMSALSQVPGVRLLSLQRGPAALDAARIPAADAGTDDVMSTARLLRALDLVITVDTFIAHLAGALGVPVWLLLHHQCDWRWGRAGHSTIWYPTMRLFRQPAPSQWGAVIDTVAAELRLLRNNPRGQEQTNIQ